MESIYELQLLDANKQSNIHVIIMMLIFDNKHFYFKIPLSHKFKNEKYNLLFC